MHTCILSGVRFILTGSFYLESALVIFSKEYVTLKILRPSVLKTGTLGEKF